MSTVLPSAARTATTTINLRSGGKRGLLIAVDVTAFAATPAVTPAIKVKDGNGDYNGIYWTAAAAITNVTGSTTYTYLLYPSTVAADFDGTEAVGLPVPPDCQLQMVHGDADSITYSVKVYWLN